MRSARLLFLVVSVLGAGATPGARASDDRSRGEAPTHLNVPSDHIVMLRTAVVPTDNAPAQFFYDADPVLPFGAVPQGYSFVITDANVIPEATPIRADEAYLVVIEIAGTRLFTSRFIGASRAEHFTAGLVIPEGQSVDVRNTPSSANPIVVELLGYFVRGPGLPPMTAFSPRRGR